MAFAFSIPASISTMKRIVSSLQMRALRPGRTRPGRSGHHYNSSRSAFASFKSRLADDVVDHGLDVAVRQPVDGQSGYMRLSNPRWLELWTERDDQQYTQSPKSIHRPTESFQARRV